jgi:hypothetical protein
MVYNQQSNASRKHMNIKNNSFSARCLFIFPNKLAQPLASFYAADNAVKLTPVKEVGDSRYQLHE